MQPRRAAGEFAGEVLVAGPYARGVTETSTASAHRGRIFHLAPAGDGVRSLDTSAAEQFERHGFVHCCTREQILEIASWWLGGVGPLAVVEIDAARAGDVRFEPADLGRRYPHVYNALPADAIVSIHALDDPDVLPVSLADPPPAFRVEVRTTDGRRTEVRWCNGDLAGDHDVRTEVEKLVAEGGTVLQFPAVGRAADLTTPYGAFCVINATVDEIVDYAGDGWF